MSVGSGGSSTFFDKLLIFNAINCRPLIPVGLACLKDSEEVVSKAVLLPLNTLTPK